MPVTYTPVHLMYVLNIEIASVTETAPFNTVRFMVVKIWCIYIEREQRTEEKQVILLVVN